MIQVIINISLLITASMVIFTKDNKNALVFLAVFSMILSFAYLIANAPDVALTEAALGCGLSTIIYIIAIRSTSSKALSNKKSED